MVEGLERQAGPHEDRGQAGQGRGRQPWGCRGGGRRGDGTEDRLGAGISSLFLPAWPSDHPSPLRRGQEDAAEGHKTCESLFRRLQSALRKSEAAWPRLACLTKIG